MTDEERDIGIWDIARGSLTRFTFHRAVDGNPAWTPDGRRLVFSSNRDGAQNLYWQSADGTGPVERLTQSANSHAALAFTPDASRLVFREVAPNSASNLSLLALNGEGRIQPLLRSSFAESNGRLSPDGCWLAYMSNESGRNEVYVRPFPEVEKGRWQISTGGGNRPVWARTGRELFYVAASGSLMGVPIRGERTFESGSPAVLFDATAYFEGPGANPDYDVSLDGQRFLMVKQGGSGDTPSLVVVQNGLHALLRVVPTK